ncbi:hypothetical protein ACF0H5_003221 [Mactra antiquata]
MYAEQNLIMMRNVQPTTALPVTRNMPYYSASVPSRNQPRNMTGIYLGLEGNVNPPLNRGTTFVRTRKGVSQKIRTPAEDRRYKMVDMLRIKEETKGFKGKALKKRQPSAEVYESENVSPRCSHPQQLKHRKWGPAKSADPRHFEDVIRTNPRQYTGIINNGVTRSENLTGLMSFADEYGWDFTNMPVPDALVEEIQRVAKTREDLQGLEDCFKKVCKGNAESIHSLLPLRKPPLVRPGSYTPGTYSTGFTVRSYRNPNKAEILADFEAQPDYVRPKTVPATGVSNSRQPFVPAPYFFKHFNRVNTASSSKKRTSPSSQFEAEIGNSVNPDKIHGVPGSGGITKSLRNSKSTAWGEPDMIRIRKGSPRNDSPMKDFDRGTTRYDNSVNSTAPLEIRAEGFQLNTEEKTAQNTDRSNSETRNTVRSDSHTGRSSKRPGDTNNKQEDNLNLEVVGQGNSSMEQEVDRTIRLDLETEDGKKQEIFIDDKDTTNDRVTQRRASEAKIASMQEDAKQRKKELEQILDEHQMIVKDIVRQSSHES